MHLFCLLIMGLGTIKHANRFPCLRPVISECRSGEMAPRQSFSTDIFPDWERRKILKSWHGERSNRSKISAQHLLRILRSCHHFLLSNHARKCYRSYLRAILVGFRKSLVVMSGPCALGALNGVRATAVSTGQHHSRRGKGCTVIRKLRLVTRLKHRCE